MKNVDVLRRRKGESSFIMYVDVLENEARGVIMAMDNKKHTLV